MSPQLIEFVPFGRDKHLSLSVAIKTKTFTHELRRIEINASSSASTVYLAKTKAITHILTYATVFRAATFMSRNAKAWRALLQKEELCRAKTLSNVTFL